MMGRTSSSKAVRSSSARSGTARSVGWWPNSITTQSHVGIPVNSHVLGSRASSSGVGGSTRTAHDTTHRSNTARRFTPAGAPGPAAWSGSLHDRRRAVKSAWIRASNSSTIARISAYFSACSTFASVAPSVPDITTLAYNRRDHAGNCVSFSRTSSAKRIVTVSKRIPAASSDGEYLLG